jgi:DNA (cytosine-5)-methyltransferase 1
VDERSIAVVQPDDLRGYTQCHFFAGIGGWLSALQFAGWPTTRPVWTGSCPCQPFSSAGQNKGLADERHLWPVWFNLIKECRPSTVFGEQVVRAINHGWLDQVWNDFEDEDYAFGSKGLTSADFEGDHERQRIWFVAYAEEANDYRRPIEVRETYGRSMRHKNAGFVRTVDCRMEQYFLLTGADGKKLTAPRGIPLLVDGLPKDALGYVSCYGNAIDPRVGAAFIEAFMEYVP